ncbi:MAG: alpha/beta hydrolase [Candidatus Nanopelagicales bacterium]|nr:alpha/beta hydrolase [Candidatus Nanopelagicales bacterium]MDZ4248664.1 alpha/beta hydrolase [Candidatus Nanopelagicales bacterium]
MNLTPQAAVMFPGPWEHRDVAANGARFHTVHCGAGPLVVLLHGFPMYWWTWRTHLGALADAGYHAVAMDLRGYGGSDHTPHGYDPMTLSADVAGVIRSLGESSAVVVGHGLGGTVAWSAAVMRAPVIRAIATVSAPHPVRMRQANTQDPEQRRLSRYTLGFQWPLAPEHSLVKKDAERVEFLLRLWSGTPGWPDPETALMFRRAMQFSSTAHCALEYYRWAFRSIQRSDGRQFIHRMRFPVQQPVLQILGDSDVSILGRTYAGSEAYVTGPFDRVDMRSIGHFPHEEDGVRFCEALVPWLNKVHSR